jgi:hypothetical protein
MAVETRGYLALRHVGIRLLMIDAEQMTPWIFRQLPKRILIDTFTGEMYGHPWGKVNYFWGRCSGARHLHIIFDEEGELYRACVYPRRTREEAVEGLPTDPEWQQIYNELDSFPTLFLGEDDGRTDTDD